MKQGGGCPGLSCDLVYIPVWENKGEAYSDRSHMPGSGGLVLYPCCPDEKRRYMMRSIRGICMNRLNG